MHCPDTSYRAATQFHNCYLQLLEPTYFCTATDITLFALHAVVVDICACRADQDRDLRGKCSNMALILKCFSSASTVFCLVYFLFKKDLAESNFFTNLKITDHSTPGYLWRTCFYMIYFIYFFKYILHRTTCCSSVCFTISIQYREKRCLNVLIEKKHTKC